MRFDTGYIDTGIYMRSIALSIANAAFLILYSIFGSENLMYVIYFSAALSIFNSFDIRQLTKAVNLHLHQLNYRNDAIHKSILVADYDTIHLIENKERDILDQYTPPKE